jgi:hypothetical protein
VLEQREAEGDPHSAKAHWADAFEAAKNDDWQHQLASLQELSKQTPTPSPIAKQLRDHAS